MKRQWMRRVAVAVFLLGVIALTWPIAAWFSAAEPLIMGFPLSMAWPIGWIIVIWVTLLLLDHIENRGDSA